MANKIIGLMGYSGSGKSTVANYLNSAHLFEHHAFADALKGHLYVLDPVIYSYVTHDPETGHCEGEEEVHLSEVIGRHGWDGAKRQYPEIRRLLQTYGQQLRDQVGENYWITLLSRATDHAPPYLVISDVRYENEARYVTEDGGELWFVQRPTAGPINGHLSDQPLWHTLSALGYKNIVLIENSGDLDQLHKSIDAVMSHLPSE